MRTRRRGACVAAILLVTGRAVPTITVDDGDPGLEYHGAWTHNPWGNQNVNYGSSVTFTNSSGSTATYKFQGIGIAVFGAFEMSGTFNVHSTYSIDGGTPTDFAPANTFVSFEYNQKFFQSDTLSNDEHTLVITNLGEEFWLDYLVVTQTSPPTTTTTKSSVPQTVQTTSQRPAPTTACATNSAATSSAGRTETVQSNSTKHIVLFPYSQRYTHLHSCGGASSTQPQRKNHNASKAMSTSAKPELHECSVAINIPVEHIAEFYKASRGVRVHPSPVS